MSGRVERKPLDPELDLWEMQPGESRPAFEKFTGYLEQTGPRSMRRLARDFHVSLNACAELARRWSWQERIAAWDRERNRERREADLQATRSMAKRQATQAAAMQTALMEPVMRFLEHVRQANNEGKDPFWDYDLRELQRSAEMCARAYPGVATFERLSRGMSTTNVGGHAGGPIEVDVTRAEMESKTREELETYLLGVEDGVRREHERAAAATEP